MTEMPFQNRLQMADAGGRDVAVAIVNYCTADLTIACLKSLAAERDAVPELEVYVSDNASPDGSGEVIAAAIVRHGWSDWARVLPNPRNGGFAYGNNQVIRAIGAAGRNPDYLWLLNSDTVVRPGALLSLIDFLKANPSVGVAGSRLEWENGERQQSAFRFHSIVSEFEGGLRFGPATRLLKSWKVSPPLSDMPERFDWLSGASMLMPYDVVERVGLMDEAYFLYFEETDYCHRISEAGYSCAYVPLSRVIHYVGQSTGVVSGRPKRLPQYWFDSRRRYFMNNYGRLYTVGADAALWIGHLFGYGLDVLRGREPAMPKGFLGDLVRNSALFHGRGELET